MRSMRRVSPFLLLALIVLALGNEPGSRSALEMASSPYKFGLVRWELANLPDKWWGQVAGALPWASRDQEEGRQHLQDFFALAGELRLAQWELEHMIARAPYHAGDPAQVREQIATLRRRLDAASPLAQSVLEAEVGAVLEKEGLDSPVIGVFPPVDLVFTDPPQVLVVSPRDRISRQATVLLEAQTDVAEMEALEERILREQDLAALVMKTGGIATYPSITPASGDLRWTTITAVHEWLHQYWFFRPLGRNYFANESMTTLNETAANLASEEMGDEAYRAITGQPAPEQETPQQDDAPADPEAFDFGAEMRRTRLEADRLLEQGRVEEAEAYMEARRRVFTENGYPLRKLNQAYFAFHGSYGDSPASVSPIQGQLDRLRASVASPGEFVRAVAQFGSYAEFEEYVSSLPQTE